MPWHRGGLGPAVADAELSAAAWQRMSMACSNNSSLQSTPWCDAGQADRGSRRRQPPLFVDALPLRTGNSAPGHTGRDQGIGPFMPEANSGHGLGVPWARPRRVGTLRWWLSPAAADRSAKASKPCSFVDGAARGICQAARDGPHAGWSAARSDGSDGSDGLMGSLGRRDPMHTDKPGLGMLAPAGQPAQRISPDDRPAAWTTRPEGGRLAPRAVACRQGARRLATRAWPQEGRSALGPAHHPVPGATRLPSSKWSSPTMAKPWRW